MKKKVSERAVFARARRAYYKKGVILRKHHSGHKDFLLNGELYAYTVDENNTIDGFFTYSGFIEVCEESGIIKEYEEIIND